jgi:hypothetical protein
MICLGNKQSSISRFVHHDVNIKNKGLNSRASTHVFRAFYVEFYHKYTRTKGVKVVYIPQTSQEYENADPFLYSIDFALYNMHTSTVTSKVH